VGGLNLNRRAFPLGHVVGIPAQEGGNRSSVSSEGFCENDVLNPNDTDEASDTSSSHRQVSKVDSNYNYDLNISVIKLNQPSFAEKVLFFTHIV
jgi:hypothetical protein